MTAGSRLLRLSGAFLLGLTAPLAAVAATSSPEATVAQYQTALLTVMKQARQLGHAGRARKLAQPVSAAYDLPYLARRAAGRHWRKFNRDQRKRYAAAFARLSISAHASRFTGYSGERFQIVGTDDPGRGYKLVKTRLLRRTGAPIVINYLMQRRRGRWKIIDVFLKGTISEVATRRSEFASVLSRGGPEALIRQINAKAGRAGG